MKVQVYAKLNLTLNVFGKRDDYHIIDSLSTSVDIFDVVSVVKRADKQVTVSGLPKIPLDKNTAYKAACGFVRQFDVCGADITINKHIPFGAGLGGSSADAAAAVYCMCKLNGIDVNSGAVRSLCASVGSDVNFMLRGGLGRLGGKGDKVEYYDLGKQLYFALTLFDVNMSTADVYSQYDKLPEEHIYVNNDALAEILQKEKFRGIAECLNNNLQIAASSLSGYASNYIEFCVGQGLRFNMTGSGSAYYVAFDDEQSAIAACNLLNANGFNTVVCRSVKRGIEEL